MLNKTILISLDVSLIKVVHNTKLMRLIGCVQL